MSGELAGLILGIIYPLIKGAISQYLASLSGTLGKWGCPIPMTGFVIGLLHNIKVISV